MKLKKIASLALAGVMAVSMLTACGGNTIDEQPPVDNSGDNAVAGYSTEVYENLSAAAQSKISFSNSSELNSALTKAMAYVASNDIANKYDENMYNKVMHVKQNTVDASMLNAAKSLIDTRKAENDTYMNVETAIEKLAPTIANQGEKTLNVDLLFVIDVGVKMSAVMDQIADQIDTQIVKLELDNDNITTNNESTLRYTYTGSVSADTITLAGDHNKSATFVAVEITRTLG